MGMEADSDSHGAAAPAVPEMFRHLRTTDAALFHRSADPSDRSMGEIVSSRPEDYHQSRIVQLGYPEDEGVRRNHGRAGAADAPREIRRQLFRLSAPATLLEGRAMMDAGDVRLGATLEETHTRLRDILGVLHRDGKGAIVLGGGNDISYPDVAALSDVCGARRVLALNIDSHFDVREAEQTTSGTPYRQLLEEGYLEPGNLFPLGHKPGTNSPVYAAYLAKKGVRPLSLQEVRARGLDAALDAILARRDVDALFWGFDMDAVKSGDAPGVSAGYPVGFTGAEVCRIAARAGADPRSRVLEISECNPRFDVDGRTARLAAMMIVAYLAAREEDGPAGTGFAPDAGSASRR